VLPAAVLDGGFDDPDVSLVVTAHHTMPPGRAGGDHSRGQKRWLTRASSASAPPSTRVVREPAGLAGRDMIVRA